MLKKIFSEFKEFASKGDMISLAIGVVIGGAFKGVIDSLVADIIMPPITYLTARVNFGNLFVALDGKDYSTLEQARNSGAAVISYGLFINQMLVFFITAFAIFIFVYKVQENLKGKKKDGTLKPNTKECKYCFSTINIKATKCPHCTSKV